MARESHFDVVVLGLGGMGLAACRELARRGVRVLGLEQHAIGHRLGSSHGGTRVVRVAYFEHADYVPLLRRAMAGFDRIEAESGEAIIERCGVAIVGGADSTLIAASGESARLHAIPVEILEGEALRSRLPQFFAFDGSGPARAILEPDAGFVRPERTLRALAALARRDGAVLREHTRVRGWSREAGSIAIEIDDGRIEAERLVLTGGAWAPALLEPVGGDVTTWPLSVTRQVQAWLRPVAIDLAEPGRLPAWLVDRGEGLAPLYGVPVDPRAAPTDLGRGLAKVALHGEGEPCEPDQVERTVRAEELETLAALAARHLPGLRGGIESSSVCLYTNSPDGHFLIDRHPLDDRVVVATGFSGHGFKFVPVVGEALADLATAGRSDLPIGFLSAARFA